MSVKHDNSNISDIDSIFPRMSKFEKNVVTKFTNLLSDEDDDKMITPIDLTKIIREEFNLIIEKDKEKNISRSQMDRINSIGFIPKQSDDGTLNQYNNPTCTILMCIIMLGFKEPSKESRESIKECLKESWYKFLKHYYPDIDFYEDN